MNIKKVQETYKEKYDIPSFGLLETTVTLEICHNRWRRNDFPVHTEYGVKKGTKVDYFKLESIVLPDSKVGLRNCVVEIKTVLEPYFGGDFYLKPTKTLLEAQEELKETGEEIRPKVEKALYEILKEIRSMKKPKRKTKKKKGPKPTMAPNRTVKEWGGTNRRMPLPQ